jgi:hypothetical protein
MIFRCCNNGTLCMKYQEDDGLPGKGAMDNMEING